MGVRELQMMLDGMTIFSGEVEVGGGVEVRVKARGTCTDPMRDAGAGVMPAALTLIGFESLGGRIPINMAEYIRTPNLTPTLTLSS